MKVLLYAEGSRELGAGHQVRCAALARALLARGHAPLLMSRELPGSAHAWAWLTLPQQLLPCDVDFRTSLREAVRRERPDVLVVDHYASDAAVIGELGADTPLALLDDVPDARAASARLIVNPAPGVAASEYPSSAVALGPAHALVRPEFAAQPDRPREPRVLVALGSAALNRDALRDALRQATPHPLDWVGAPHLDAEALAASMARASVGLLSASSVCFEAACARLPFVAVVTASNQRRLARGLAAGGVPVLSVEEACDAARLAAALARAGEARPPQVDGRGAERVAARLFELTLRGAAIALRPAVWNDAALLLAWSNDPGARRASFEEHTIQQQEHAHWLAEKLLDPDARLFLAVDGADVGTLRLQRAAGVATVSIAVAPSQRGRGIGARVLRALREWAGASGFAERLEAFVREDNPGSLRLFERAGYAVTGRLLLKQRPAVRFEQPV